MINHRNVYDDDDTTVIFAKIDELAPAPAIEDLELLRDALALVQELWPVPRHATVALETHQWERLRKVLLAIPDLLARAER